MVGRYRVISRLGRGGMGEVLRAVNPETGQHVALKLLDAEGYEDEDLLRRFEREAEAVREIEHQNIARFFGLERDEHGLPFIVMEFIEGQPLDRYLKNHPDLPLSRALSFVAQAARGLEFARRRAVIHRDIKPANLIIQPDDKLKIIDFGLAKSLWDRSALTNTGTVLGTPRYMAPEQAMGRSVDHRADLYSLGATFYELVTGQAPFDGDSPAAIMMKHINSPLVEPSKVNSRVPIEVNDIIVRMMAKDPSERYQDYESLIRDLEMARIQQMSREKRGEAETQVLDPEKTVLDPENGPTLLEGSEPSSGPAPLSRPSSYLTEGLVQVEYREEEEPQPPSRFLLYTGTGLLILGVAAFFLFRQTSQEPAEKEPSALTRLVGRLAGNDRFSEPSAAELAARDRKMIRETVERMDSLRVKILRYRDEKMAPGEMPLIREMRMNEAITEEESRDAWGNDFYISRGDRGAYFLYAAGRDSTEGTADDFALALDGSKREIPPALTEEYFVRERMEE